MCIRDSRDTGGGDAQLCPSASMSSCWRDEALERELWKDAAALNVCGSSGGSRGPGRGRHRGRSSGDSRGGRWRSEAETGGKTRKTRKTSGEAGTGTKGGGSRKRTGVGGGGGEGASGSEASSSWFW